MNDRTAHSGSQVTVHSCNTAEYRTAQKTKVGITPISGNNSNFSCDKKIPDLTLYQIRYLFWLRREDLNLRLPGCECQFLPVIICGNFPQSLVAQGFSVIDL